MMALCDQYIFTLLKLKHALDPEENNDGQERYGYVVDCTPPMLRAYQQSNTGGASATLIGQCTLHIISMGQMITD
jgi:hypothetical protein